MRTLLALALAFAGCDTVLDPTGDYIGVGARSGELRGPSSEVLPSGSHAGARRRFSATAPAETVSVMRVDETHFDVDIGGTCRVRFEHAFLINVDSGTATVVPDQGCDVVVGAFAGRATLVGSATYRKHLHKSGS